MPRRTEIDASAPSQSPPITIEEAQRRGLYGIYRVRRGLYASIRVGREPFRTAFVAYAVDREAAGRACVERGRDERHPGLMRLAVAPKTRGPARAKKQPSPPEQTDPTKFNCGHGRTPENSYVFRDRKPECRDCRRRRSRESCGRGAAPGGTP